MHISYNAEDLAKVSYDINKLILVLEKTFPFTNQHGLDSNGLTNSKQTRKIKGNTISKCVTNLHLKLVANTQFKQRAALLVQFQGLQRTHKLGA